MKLFKFILRTTTFIICGTLFSTAAFATDLMEVYQTALKNDPKYKEAAAKWMDDKENLAISRAALFPQIEAGANASRSRDTVDFVGTTKTFSNTLGYSLQIKQSIFNFGNWTKIWGAQALVKKAQATFLAAKEDLLQRTAKAYFEVLLAKDVLSFSKANKESFARLLNQAKHKFDVGLIAITDLEEARAKYDKARAEEIGAANDLSNKFETLAEITGTRYSQLDSVRDNFPLISPEPTNIEQWVKTAEKQNFSLLAARFDSIVARENVKTVNAGHLPTLSATGTYSDSRNANYLNSDISRRSKTATAGLELSAPIFKGGAVVAAARQAGYQYQEATAKQEQSHRSTIRQTRQTYLGILSNISKIKADKQAIKSAQSSLRALKAGYSAGTRTMSDLLEAQSNLYSVQKDFANDEYNYILQLLTLKALIGALSADDLNQINAWLLSTTPNGKKTTNKEQGKTSSKGSKKTSSNKNPPVPRIVVLETEEVKQAGDRR